MSTRSICWALSRSIASDPDEAVRSDAAAAAAVLHRAREDLESERRLEELARSQETEDRIHVARIAAHPESPAVPGTVRQLLMDRERRVRMAAMAAAGQERYASEWPSLIRGLEAPLVAYSATSALVGSSASCPAIACSRIAASRTQRVIGPRWSSENDSDMAPCFDTRP